jgi:hypothetical protein
VYGWPAWNSHVGFTAAQASLNAVETAMYLYYLIAIYRNVSGNLLHARDVHSFLRGDESTAARGPGVAHAVLYLFSAAVMTLSKTVLYCECDHALPTMLGMCSFRPCVQE